MMQIQKSHEEEIAALALEVRVRSEALRIITGGDHEMINEVMDQARENLA